MTKTQREQLVALIFEYGNAVGAAVKADRIPGEDEMVAATVAGIRTYLEALTVDEPRSVLIDTDEGPVRYGI